MNLVRITALALGAAIALGAGAAAAQDKPVHLRFANWLPPTHALQKAFADWVARVNAASHGTITMTIYPAQQLGKAFDHYDMARDGVADVAFVNPGYQAGRFPIIAAAALPFLIANGRGGTAAVDEWYRRYAPTEMKDVHYCLGLVDNPGTLQAKTKVTLPTDLRGMKLRPPTDTMSAFIALVGGTNIHVAAPETHEALARGVADATFMPWDSLTVFGLRNVTYYHIDLPIFTSPFVVVLNEKTYRALAPDQRKAIDSNCDTAAAVRMATPLLESSHGSYVEIAKDPAHHVYKLTRTEIAAWRAAAAPLAASWEANAKKAGIGDPAAALDALRADLKKEGALLGD